MTNRNEHQSKHANKCKPAELDEAALDNAAGGKHPAKVTVPDLKLDVGYGG